MNKEELEAIKRRCEKATPWDEEWKPVPGYERLYDVSNYGRVRSYWRPGNHKHKKSKEPRLMSQKTTRHRKTVALTRDGRNTSRPVHRLVLMAFVGTCPEGHECAHLNGNFLDNRLSNLRWVTHKENESHKLRHGTNPEKERNSQSKLVGWQVAEIKFLHSKGIRQARISELFEISPEVVSSIIKGKSWRGSVARTDVPELVAEVEKLRKLLKWMDADYTTSGKHRAVNPGEWVMKIRDALGEE